MAWLTKTLFHHFENTFYFIPSLYDIKMASLYEQTPKYLKNISIRQIWMKRKQFDFYFGRKCKSRKNCNAPYLLVYLILI